MASEPIAHAAGRAFVRMTGVAAAEISSADAVAPPEPAKARAWWEKEKGRFTVEGRWQAGFDVSKTPFGENFDAMPLDARLDVYLGARAKDPQRTRDRELEKTVALKAASH